VDYKKGEIGISFKKLQLINVLHHISLF